MSRPDTGYGARNTLNASELKTQIKTRSQERGDSQEITHWLTNHFHRYLVGNFEPATPMLSTEDASRIFKEEPLPEWVSRLFEKGSSSIPIVWIDPATPQIREIENRLVEFLRARTGTRLEGKLNRLTCPQALAIWQQEHDSMAARSRRGHRKSNPNALQDVLTTDNGQWVEFRSNTPFLRDEMAFESSVMGHCLGMFHDMKTLEGGYGASYAEQIEAGFMRLLSFRGPSGKPHITLSALVNPQGKLEIEQVKGKQNRPPVERYHQDVLSILNTLDTAPVSPEDCFHIDIIHHQGRWQNLQTVTDPAQQISIIQNDPHLFNRLKNPSAPTEWLAIALNASSETSSRPAIRHILKSRQHKA